MGMTALALILKDMGNKVSGSDVNNSYPTSQILKSHNITVLHPFDEKNLQDSEVVIYSGANGGSTNIEVQKAQEKNISTFSLAQFVGELSKSKKTIAVCGSHGKSTTSSLAAYIGQKLGLPMSYYVGAPSFAGRPPGAWAKGDYFIAESDEYVADPIADRTPKFLYLHPHVIICTNIDFDHPDVFKDIQDVEKAFQKFFRNLGTKGFLVVNGDDTRLLCIAHESGKQMYTYGRESGNDFRIDQISETNAALTFSVTYQRRKIGSFSTKLLGIHNVYNATAIIALYTILNFAGENIRQALLDFTGVSRRIEFHEKIADSLLYDDYAHHPTEIAASLAALRKRFPKHHLTVIFQPHTFSRTERLKNEFINSLKGADTAILLPIFASARESADEFTVNSEQLVMEAQQQGHTNFEHVITDSELTFLVNKLHKKYPLQIFLTMGAGDVYNKLDVVKKTLV